MCKSTLAIIDSNIRSGQDELAREDVLARLRRYTHPCVTPLWVNWLRPRADLRLVCMVHELDRFDDFLIDVLREAIGVAGTRAFLSFGGRVNITHLLEVLLVAAGDQEMFAASVRIELLPGYDRSAFEALWTLPPHPHVRPVWLLRTYHSFEADLNLMLLSDDHAAINGYVMSWVRTAPGVLDTMITDVLDWQMLASPEEMIALAERFFQPQDAETQEA
ncbi:MAG: hypothetical protein HUU23_03855 [Caldilineales bacterium]|nr:hypothetical protein [Caldilineales bacterium]